MATSRVIRAVLTDPRESNPVGALDRLVLFGPDGSIISPSQILSGGPGGGEITPEALSAAGGVLTEDLPAALMDAGAVTTEELAFSIFDISSAFPTTYEFGLHDAQFALRILGFSILTTTGTSINASDTNWAQFQLKKHLPGDAPGLVIATKTTKLTGGASLLARTSWTFDNVLWDADNRKLLPGEWLGIQASVGGGAVTFPGRNLLTVRYQPIDTAT